MAKQDPLEYFFAGFGLVIGIVLAIVFFPITIVGLIIYIIYGAVSGKAGK